MYRNLRYSSKRRDTLQFQKERYVTVPKGEMRYSAKRRDTLQFQKERCVTVPKGEMRYSSKRRDTLQFQKERYVTVPKGEIRFECSLLHSSRGTCHLAFSGTWFECDEENSAFQLQPNVTASSHINTGRFLSMNQLHGVLISLFIMLVYQCWVIQTNNSTYSMTPTKAPLMCIGVFSYLTDKCRPEALLSFY
jgi:hypothetical protein